MSYRPLQLTAVLFLSILLLAAAGCSRVRIAYNSADFLIEQYARDYLALEDPQVAFWRPVLEDTLTHHRQNDLPYLARFFEDAQKGAVKGFSARRMRCLIDQLEDLYRRHMRVAVDLAAPLLAGLTPKQVQALKDKFREEEAEDEVDLDPIRVARQKRKRAERYVESIAWWVGPLTKEQKHIVWEQTAAMPDTAADWIAYRSTKRKALIEMLQRRAAEEEIHRFLDTWLVEHRELPPPLRMAREQIGDRISELFIRMDGTLSDEQRAHFAGRLADLRDDFMSLQRRPRMASADCTDAG